MNINSLLDNALFAAVIWVGAVALSFLVALVWMLYLMKIVMNDEDIQEKVRRHKRISEEIIRAEQSNKRSAA